ncbi:unnamed protein product, partial [Staurois parvus]
CAVSLGHSGSLINGKSQRFWLGHVISCVQSQLISWDMYTDHQDTDDQCSPSSATSQCPSMPAVSAHQCHINATYQCSSDLPLGVTYQCQSVPPISAANQCRLSVPVSAAYQCQSVLTISAHQCRLSVPVSAAYHCHLTVPPNSASQCRLSVPPIC